MVCCRQAISHYLNQCWLFIIEVLWHSLESNFSASAEATILYKMSFKNYCHIFSHPGTRQWVLKLGPIRPNEFSWDLPQAEAPVVEYGTIGIYPGQISRKYARYADKNSIKTDPFKDLCASEVLTDRKISCAKPQISHRCQGRMHSPVRIMLQMSPSGCQAFIWTLIYYHLDPV